MTGRPALVIFLGGLGGSQAEGMVGTARWAASLDSIEAALSTEAFARAILVVDQLSLPVDIPGVTVDADTGDFHFGRRLAGVLRRQGVASAVYMGGGSLPLFGPADFQGVAATLARGLAVTNNAYSSDLVAFPVDGRTIAVAETVERDNSLSRALAERAGLKVEALPRSMTTQMDIDGPSDLAVLSLTGWGGCRLQTYLVQLGLDTGPYRRVLPLFVDPAAQILVAGRVGSHSWRYLERETACRVRLFAEERGMEAEGRARDGAVRSLLGFHLQAVGVPRFFEAMSQLGDAAFIDTRVLLGHMRVDAGPEDRFLSDLGRWREIRDPFLREFTKAASETGVPVILGGHSLMSGGLMALNEFAWQEREAKRLVRTDPLANGPSFV